MNKKTLIRYLIPLLGSLPSVLCCEYSNYMMIACSLVFSYGLAVFMEYNYKEDTLSYLLQLLITFNFSLRISYYEDLKHYIASFILYVPSIYIAYLVSEYYKKHEKNINSKYVFIGYLVLLFGGFIYSLCWVTFANSTFVAYRFISIFVISYLYNHNKKYTWISLYGSLIFFIIMRDLGSIFTMIPMFILIYIYQSENRKKAALDVLYASILVGVVFFILNLFDDNFKFIDLILYRFSIYYDYLGVLVKKGIDEIQILGGHDLIYIPGYRYEFSILSFTKRFGLIPLMITTSLIVFYLYKMLKELGKNHIELTMVIITLCIEFVFIFLFNFIPCIPAIGIDPIFFSSGTHYFGIVAIICFTCLSVKKSEKIE